MTIAVSRNQQGNIVLQPARWSGEPGRGIFVMTADEWDELRLLAVTYELEQGRLRHTPLRISLEDALGDRLI